MVSLAQQVHPHPEVVDTELETGETVLLQLTSKTYFSLNPTGTRIWQGVKRGLTLQVISQQVQTTFAVDAEHADSSVLAFVHELCQHELAQVPER